MIAIVNGNLLDATEDIIGHQVNCQGVMGSGVAKQIRATYPFVYDQYKMMADELEGSREDLLGWCQFVDTGKHLVANLFSQLNYGRDKSVLYTDYEALRVALILLKVHAMYHNLSVALPFNIACGFANGDWDGVVYPMLEEIFLDYSLTLYKYEG